ncbi:hypothetical protein QQS21_000042 [Conoideocrella luteorostrata]|uniref:Regulatory P domain-containing protein n=1 Tax=Conoideocrella luteorostrata TaxID=1105319 RepID=A0AAJ0CZR5_9HYPO|nr:hypothetical protein QQS21_000042 [Conoideocrella luteorostrata]
MKLAGVITLLAFAICHVAAESAMAAMSRYMGLKVSAHGSKQDAGVFAKNKYKSMGPTRCKDGHAGEYGCQNVDVQASLTHEALGSSTREGNDIWGWTSPDGREFAIVGQTDGTAFAEVLKGGRLVFLGRLPTQTGNEIWRDIKVIDHYAYISSESPGHGIQVFDLNKLLSLKCKQPKVFDIHSDLTAHFNQLGSAHNVIANPESNTIFISGAKDATCKDLKEGLLMMDVKDPARPTLTGCFGGGDYVHDARCVIYRGPDSRFHGREICLTFNIHSFMVYDVTDRKNTTILSNNYYDGIDGKGAFTHQGWELDSDFRYMLMDDEQDEEQRDHRGLNTKTTTYIWDISSLTHPNMTGTYKSPVDAIDHNLYIVNHVAYMANYASGLRVVDVSGVPNDPTGGNMKELAYFDCWPDDDDEPEVAFYGAWSTYAWFKSGTVVINCIERGLFALKVNI